mgnify:CR=1 FL=1
MDLYHHQLIVLGNGFDIALGLNTGYADYSTAIMVNVLKWII